MQNKVLRNRKQAIENGAERLGGELNVRQIQAEKKQFQFRRASSLTWCSAKSTKYEKYEKYEGKTDPAKDSTLLWEKLLRPSFFFLHTLMPKSTKHNALTSGALWCEEVAHTCMMM